MHVLKNLNSILRTRSSASNRCSVLMDWSCSAQSILFTYGPNCLPASCWNCVQVGCWNNHAACCCLNCPGFLSNCRLLPTCENPDGKWSSMLSLKGAPPHDSFSVLVACILGVERNGCIWKRQLVNRFAELAVFSAPSFCTFSRCSSPCTKVIYLSSREAVMASSFLMELVQLPWFQRVD